LGAMSYREGRARAELEGRRKNHTDSRIEGKMIALLLNALLVAGQDGGKVDQEAWDKSVTKGIEFLRKSQAADGSWSGRITPGITGIVVTGLLRSGKVTADDPTVAKGLAYIEGLVNREAGHIAGKATRLQNYITCVNVMALVEANRESYRPVLKDATRFLGQLQQDEAEKVDASQPNYGGAGYDSASRPDLSNTQVFLDALVAAGVPKTDPSFKKALVFVSRCQNLASENNNLPLAGKINDGSFTYLSLSGGPRSNPEGEPGYGSMTYAGIKSMIYCGVDANDPRMKKALEWIKANYDLEKHPGKGEQGLYYYYHTMAKCLDTMGLEEVVDAKGVAHPWRKELTAKLVSLQKPDGSWVNKNNALMEGNPDLSTGFALMALSHTKGAKK